MAGKVAVVGSYNTGFLIYVDRLPAEGETLAGHGFRMEHGGKGSNQAIQSSRLGCSTTMIARIGDDIFGERALAKWREEHIDTRYVVRDVEKPTGAGLIIVGPAGKNIIAVDLGANMGLSVEDVEKAREAIEKTDVILSQLEIPVETSLHALRKRDAISILNPAPATILEPARLNGINIITPNEVEVKTLAGYNPNEAVDPISIGEKYAKYVEHVVITLGERGAAVINKNGKREIPAPKVDAIDTTGAGDAFNGALATALAKGYTIEEAVEYACYAGAFLVARIKRGELVEALANDKELEKFISEHRG